MNEKPLTEIDVQRIVRKLLSLQPPTSYIRGQGVSRIIVSDTEPEHPNVQDIWIDTSS